MGQAGARPHAGGGPPDLRHPARREEGHQGRRRAAGHVRGPRPEVHRAGRRPRHRGGRARAAPGPRLRRPGPRALHHPQGPAATSTPRTTRRPLPRHRRDRPRDRPAARGRRAPPWTRVFADEMVAIGARARATSSASPRRCSSRSGWTRSPRRSRTASSTSASPSSTPTTSAAGLAIGGLHPVVAVYATFLNRAFDQVLMDVALHQCGVTFCLDRAGVTGDDGASHNGMWDMAFLQVVPGLRHRGAARRRHPARGAARGRRGRRRPDRGALPDRRGGRRPAGPGARRTASTCCAADGEPTCCSSRSGAMAETCLEVADRCAQQGIGVTVVDPRWVKPVPAALVRLAAGDAPWSSSRTACGRRGRRCGRAGAARRRVPTPLRDFGIPLRFLDHAQARRGARRDRPHRPGHRARHRRDRGRPAEPRRAAHPRRLGSGLAGTVLA